MTVKNVLILLSTCLAILFTNNIQADAKVEEFKNLEDLNEYVDENQDRDLQIKLAKDFNIQNAQMYLNTNHNVEIDGNDNVFNSILIVEFNGKGILKMKDMKFVDGEHDTALVLKTFPEQTEVIIDSFIFEDIKNESLSPLCNETRNSKVTVKNTLFENNSALLGGGIRNEMINGEQVIKDSTFINNRNTGGFGGGAYTALYNRMKTTIENSAFINNATDNNFEYSNLAGGAIFVEMRGGENQLNVKDSYLKNNHVENLQLMNESFEGGAITVSTSYSDFDSKHEFNVSNSTFENNHGVGGGGAIAVEDWFVLNGEFNFENNTFYKNYSFSSLNNRMSGGAILLRNYDLNHEAEAEAIDSVLMSKNNTFYKNYMKRNNQINPSEDVKGGAIGIDEVIGTHTLTNDLLVGNELKNNQNPSKLFENVFITDGIVNQTDSLGFDNGVASKTNEQMVYGKYPVDLVSNQGKVKAGVLNDRIVIPTLPIAPKMNANLGVANMNVSNAPELDQRGYKRTGKNDNGAIEISSVLYDANKGNFTLNELKKYDGQTYYEGKNPKQYAKVDVPSKQYTILDGKKILKPVRSGYTFLGWSNSKAAKVQNSKFKAGTKHKVDDQLVVYAVWKENKFTIKYFNNGKTTGIIPSQKDVKPGTTVTVKNPTKMKRKGYKFIGWSTKPNATKPNANYKPGKVFKLTKNIKLYAVWKR